MKSRGLLKPPFLFMYWRYFLLVTTFTAPTSFPFTFLPLVEWKEPKPSISFIIRSSSVISDIGGSSCVPVGPVVFMGGGVTGLFLRLLPLAGERERDRLRRSERSRDLDLLRRSLSLSL